MSASERDGPAGQRITWVGAGANVFLIAAKIAACLLGHSQALVADAVHSVSDLFTDAIVLVGLKVGRKAPDADHHFGHGRIETQTSGIVGVSLLAVAGGLGYQAAVNIYEGYVYHPTWLALLGAAVSILVKEILYRYTVQVGRRIGSPVVVANAWHHRSDAFSSVAVLIGVGGAQLNPDWHILDSVATVVVSLFVAKVGWGVLWTAMREMVDTAPDPEVVDQISKLARDVSGVWGLHDLKVRSVGGRFHVQVHVEVDGSLTVAEGHRIAKQVERRLRDGHPKVVAVIVHVDPSGDHDRGAGSET